MTTTPGRILSSLQQFFHCKDCVTDLESRFLIADQISQARAEDEPDAGLSNQMDLHVRLQIRSNRPSIILSSQIIRG